MDNANNSTYALNDTRRAAAGTANSLNDFDYYLWVIASPIIFFPGIIGNVLTTVVIMRPVFRHTTTGVYLPLIAIADGIVLLSGLLPDWLEWVGIFNTKEFSVWTCRLHKFVFYTAGDVSIWLIVAFTFDRFIAVCFPLTKRTVCEPRRSVYASIAITVLFAFKNAHEFWTRGIQYNAHGEIKLVCGLPADYFHFHAYVRPWIAFTLITALPFILILLFNCLIVHSLIRAQRMRALHAVGAPTGGAAGGSQAATASYRQTTLMCLSVSFAFLACILPSIIMLIGKMKWNSPDTSVSTRLAYKRAKAVNNLLVYVNHSINFMLYCLTGRKFRDELRAMFKRPGNTRKPVNNKTAQNNTIGFTATTGDKTRGTESGLVTATTEVCGQDSND